MNKGKIFLVGDKEESLEPMVETPYEAEEILQVLLEKYPDLLPGDQISPENPKKWILISREMSIPGEDGGGGVWSLDHLFVDQDGMPTFVECKRASDTRIRREVVAQMLDYAANGTRYWTVDKLRESAAETAEDAGTNLNREVGTLLGDSNGPAIDAFWDKVEENLKEGRIRLLFVADEIPRELHRLIEFMNEKMEDVEVLGVEIKQFVGSGKKAVVPRLIGQTERARIKKYPRKTKTNRSEFLGKSPEGIRPFFKYVLDSADQKGYVINWGTVGFSARIEMPPDGKLASFAWIYPEGYFQIYLGEMDLSPGDEAEYRKKLLDTGEFVEGGKATLSANITDDNMKILSDAFNSALQLMKSLADR